MGLCTCLTPDTSVTAAVIMVGLLACRLTILLRSPPGRQQLLKAVSGDIVALPVTAPTCSSSRVTPPAQEACGAVEKRSFVCKPARFGPVCPATTGRLQIGFRSITATLISAVSAPCSSTCLELRLPSSYSRQERI